ncbi:phosphoenolpyruvate--protein phosphotransferase [Nocardia arthritidis]|uniref:Phosphocarrier protein HPr n=1 Tax=Nocardia arthritidis TaxID=228602 RepID=A0A6G9YR02_9NOCA|nr:phosphoenolpyruvate--protein phosphotransferase [Nocardia arthritidis]QIS15333.1 phosphoenolpyruvate--protein phosphotransferase [Nocardia arthritidis]
MIGIVVVSHSRPLARAAVALATEMQGERPVRVEIAAGLDEETLGTDAVAVAEAIAAADSGDGVLLLMDLGSAVLSAELAIDLLESPHEVKLCAAPIVEGLVAAVVTAGSGASLDEVAAEAENALLGKRSQLGMDGQAQPATDATPEHDTHPRPSEKASGQPQPAADATPEHDTHPRPSEKASGQPRPAADITPGQDTHLRPGDEPGEHHPIVTNSGAQHDNSIQRTTIVVRNEHGLHARPAARLVAALRGIDTDVRLRNLTTGAGPVSGRSLTRIAALGVLTGHQIEVSATGTDAATAIDRIRALADRWFDEEPTEAERNASHTRSTESARPATESPDAASGSLHAADSAAGPSDAAPTDYEPGQSAAPVGTSSAFNNASESIRTTPEPTDQSGSPTKRSDATPNGREPRLSTASVSAPASSDASESIRTTPESADHPGSSAEQPGATPTDSESARSAASRGAPRSTSPATGSNRVAPEVLAGTQGGIESVGGAIESTDAGGSRPPGTEPEGRRTGPYPASAGIGIGPVWHLATTEFTLPEHPAGAPVDEQRALDDAIGRVREQLTADIARSDGGRSPEADIFEAHLILLDDEDLTDEVRRRIADGAPAATAFAAVFDGAAAELARLPDEYQRARAADVRAVRDQVLVVLLGYSSEFVTRPGILVAADLTPGQLAALDRSLLDGIVLAQGSPTAHSAILARSKGIPAVVGAGAEVLRIPEDTVVALDGGTGRLVVAPKPSVLAEFETRAREQDEQRRAAEAAAQERAVTENGTEIHVAANVGSVADAVDAVRAGADLAGLVRTEFLFLGREHAPTVAEQTEVYRELAKVFDGRRIILRTLDVGGDKPLPYIDQRPEANPFLGLRGIRLALAHPDLLRDQLRAVAAVAADHPVSVMFPMVTGLDELQAARKILNEVAPQDLSLEIGIMIEVPAAAVKAAVLAEYVDFFSIGTNDLTQYAMAVDRGNDTIAALADPLDPGVLRLIDLVCRGAGDTRVAVCGEIAADPAAVPLLLGLGVTELSVAPPAVAMVKAQVRTLDTTRCRALAVEALGCESAAQVRGLVRRQA